MRLENNLVFHGQGDPPEVSFARGILIEEAAALTSLAEGLDQNFVHASRLIRSSHGRLVIGGLGKSGHVARKIAATFTSTGTPAIFLHLAEALHGDLGAIRPGDVGLLISHSGETPELLPVIRFMQELGVPLIAITANAASALAAAADAPIVLPAWQEAGPNGLAPTTSTLMTLAVGDALAMTVMRARHFGRRDFHRLHPGGALGTRLRPVSSEMHHGSAVPLVRADTPMLEAVLEMTAKRLGLVGVVDGQGLLVGVVTDGDLRRNLDRLSRSTAGDIMTRRPKLVRPAALASDAREMMAQHKITALFVVEDPGHPLPIGVIHIHDLPCEPATP